MFSLQGTELRYLATIGDSIFFSFYSGGRIQGILFPIATFSLENTDSGSSIDFLRGSDIVARVTFDESQPNGNLEPLAGRTSGGEAFMRPAEDEPGVYRPDPRLFFYYLLEKDEAVKVNLLLIERHFVGGGKLRITHEEVRQAGSVRLDCYAARFINAGTTTVMVGRVPLENNEEYKIDGTPGAENDTTFQVVFDDSTTGTAITKKATGAQAVRILGNESS